MRPSLVILNPNASRVREAAVRDRISAGLAAALTSRDGAAPDIVETAQEDDVEPLVEQAKSAGVPSVVGVGGDGTMRQLGAGLRGSSIPLGIIPAGTGNQIGAVLGVPRSLDHAVDALRSAVPRTIDLGEVTVRTPEDEVSSTTFIIGCGAGLDAALMATTPATLKKRIGTAAYLIQGVKLGLGISTQPYRLTVDGRTLETDASIAVIGNMGQLIPGRVDLRLPIDPADGLLDLIVVGASGPLYGLLGMVRELARTELGGGGGDANIRLRGERISVAPVARTPVEIDGDHVGDGSLEARVLPAAFDVLIPAS